MFIHFSHTSWEMPVSFCSVCDQLCEPNHQLLTSRERLMLSRKTLHFGKQNLWEHIEQFQEDQRGHFSHSHSISDFLEHTWCQRFHKAPVNTTVSNVFARGHYIKLYIRRMCKNIRNTQLTQLFHTVHVLYVICFTSGAPLFPWPTWRLITKLYMHISSLFYSLS